MADSLLRKIGDWWTTNVAAPQAADWPEASNQLFQNRKTGVPGAVRQISPGVMGKQLDGDPSVDLVQAAMDHGPKTDIDTARALGTIRTEWGNRHQQKPDEGYVLIDPRAAMDSGTHSHEAAHSLFSQMAITPEQNRALGESAPFVASNARDNPTLRATEGAAYAVGAPSPDTAEEAFMRDLIGIGKRNGRADAANQMEGLYRGRATKRSLLTK